MRLDAIILADAAAQAGGKLSILGAFTTRLNPPEFPWREPQLAIVVRLILEDEDLDRNQAVEIRIDGPVEAAGDRIRSTFDVTAASVQHTREQVVEGEVVSLVLTSITMGALFPAPGLYHVVVSRDGEEMGRVALPVLAPPETPASTMT